MTDIILEKPKRRKKEVRDLCDITYISGIAPADSIVLDNSDYGETYGVCLAHFNWLCSYCRADKKNTRALILELTWSSNEMKVICEAQLN